MIEAFAVYGATLENATYAFSAVAPDGSVVMSCWLHRLIGDERVGYSYMGHLTRWRDNRVGAEIFARHLKLAWAEKRPLRLVVASAGDTLKVEQSMNLDKMVKVYTARPELMGELVSFDGNDFAYEFKRIDRAAKSSRSLHSRRPASNG